MIDTILNSGLIFQFIAAFSAIYYKSKFDSKTVNCYAWYLVFVFIIDSTGTSFRYISVNNLPLYNIYFVGSILFTLWFFYRHINHKNRRIFYHLSLVVLGLALCVSIYMQSFTNDLYNLFYIVGMFVNICWIIAFINELLLTEIVLHLRNHVTFWIAIGTLFYYLGTLPLISILNYFPEVGGGQNLLIVLFIFNFIFYTINAYGFKVANKE